MLAGVSAVCSPTPVTPSQHCTSLALRVLGLFGLLWNVRGQLFPEQLELFSLNGTAGFTLNGENAADECGFSIASAGDVNADGIDDFLIGARLAGASTGKTYVVFGRSTVMVGGTIELSSLDGSNGFIINGENSGDQSGHSTSGSGDVNGDGIADLVVGSPNADPGGRAEAGKTYVVFGKRGLGAGGTLQLSSLDGSNGFVLNGESVGDTSGRSVSNAGDVNGDGIADLLIGARLADPTPTRSEAGKTYVVFGRFGLGAGGVVELSSLDGTNGFIINGQNQGDGCGRSVGSGDVNADGIVDLLIGAYGADPGKGRAGAGKTYVVFGKRGLGNGGVFEVSSLNGSNGFALNGENMSDESGVSVSGSGDVNGDGFTDLLIGARNADPTGRTDAGKAYVVFGHPSIVSVELGSLNGSSGFILHGETAGDGNGHSIAIVDDINGDGIADLLIGGPQVDPEPSRGDAGRTYVVYGKPGLGANGSLELSEINGTTGFVVNGENSNDQSGRDVNGAGDVNGDGIADFLIAARFADPTPSRVEAGKIYVVFGRKPAPTMETSPSTQTSPTTSVAHSSTTSTTAHFSTTSMKSTAIPALRAPEANSLALPFAIAGGVWAVISSVAAAIFALKCRRKSESSEVPSQGAGESTHYASFHARASAENAEPAYGLLELKPPEVTSTVYSSGQILSASPNQESAQTHYSAMPAPEEVMR